MGEEPLRREREVAVATTQVGHPQRLGRRSAGAGVPCRSRRTPKRRGSSRTPPPGGTSPGGSASSGPSGPKGPGRRRPGRPRVSSLPLSRSCSRSASTSASRSRVCSRASALLGHPHLVGLRRGVDVPVAERLVEQRVDRRPRLVARHVVRGVCLRVVVGRDLEAAPALEVDVAQLDATPPRASCRVGDLTPRHARARRGRGGARASGPARGAGAGQASGHLRSAATTTMRRSAPSAVGMTRRRWRGFTCRV